MWCRPWSCFGFRSAFGPSVPAALAAATLSGIKATRSVLSRALGWKTCRRYSTLSTLPEATRPETREARSRSHAVVFTYETPYSDTLDMVMSVQLGVELTQAFTSAFHLVDHD